MIEITKAKLSDAKILSEVAIRTQLETFESKNPPGLCQAYCDECLNEAVIENELLDPFSEYYLTYHNKKLIGYLKLRMNNIEENKLAGENSMELQRIYLLASETGKGYGKQQLAFAENFAKQKGYDILWLGVWEHNLSAFGFYQHLGYTRFDIHDFMYGGDLQHDWMMKKTL
jgi:diamine N-acetyltransferase